MKESFLIPIPKTSQREENLRVARERFFREWSEENFLRSRSFLSRVALISLAILTTLVIFLALVVAYLLIEKISALGLLALWPSMLAENVAMYAANIAFLSALGLYLYILDRLGSDHDASPHRLFIGLIQTLQKITLILFIPLQALSNAVVWGWAYGVYLFKHQAETDAEIRWNQASEKILKTSQHFLNQKPQKNPSHAPDSDSEALEALLERQGLDAEEVARLRTTYTEKIPLKPCRIWRGLRLESLPLPVASYFSLACPQKKWELWDADDLLAGYRLYINEKHPFLSTKLAPLPPQSSGEPEESPQRKKNRLEKETFFNTLKQFLCEYKDLFDHEDISLLKGRCPSNRNPFLLEDVFFDLGTLQALDQHLHDKKPTRAAAALPSLSVQSKSKDPENRVDNNDLSLQTGSDHLGIPLPSQTEMVH